MSNLKQLAIPLTPLELSRENDRINREMIDLKQELYSVYQENIRLRDLIAKYEKEGQFYSECEAELSRLKKMMKDINEKKSSMPSEREEIKDRIIMKLEDELISTKIQLKEAQLELARVNRMQ